MPYVSRTAIGIMVASGRLTIGGQLVTTRAHLEEWLSAVDGPWHGPRELTSDVMQETRLVRLTEWLSLQGDLLSTDAMRHGNPTNDKDLEIGYTNLKKWLSSIDDILNTVTAQNNVEPRNDKK